MRRTRGEKRETESRKNGEGRGGGKKSMRGERGGERKWSEEREEQKGEGREGETVEKERKRRKRVGKRHMGEGRWGREKEPKVETYHMTPTNAFLPSPLLTMQVP